MSTGEEVGTPDLISDIGTNLPSTTSRFGRMLRPTVIAGVGLLGVLLLVGKERRAFEATPSSGKRGAQRKWWKTTGCHHVENLYQQGFSIKDAFEDTQKSAPQGLFNWGRPQAMTKAYSTRCQGDLTGKSHPWLGERAARVKWYPTDMKDFLIAVQQQPKLFTKSGRYRRYDYSDAQVIRKPEGRTGKMHWFIDNFTPSRQTKSSRAITGIPILSQRVSGHLKGYMPAKDKIRFGKTRKGSQQWTTSEFIRAAHKAHPTTDFDYSLIEKGKTITGIDFVKDIFCEETYANGIAHGVWNPDGVNARTFLGIGRQRGGTGCSICKGVWNSNLPANLYFLAIYNPNIPEADRTLHNAAFFKVGVTQNDFPDIRRQFIQADLNAGGSAGRPFRKGTARPSRRKNTAGPYTGFQTVMLGNIWYRTGHEALQVESTFVGADTHLKNPPTHFVLNTDPATGKPYKFRGSSELVNKNELPAIKRTLAGASKQYKGGKSKPTWLTEYRPKAPASMWMNEPLWRTY